MTYKRLRPGGGRGVVCHAAEPIGRGRKSFACLDLRVPASVPVKFTDLVNIPGWRVFPGLALPVHCPPSPSLPCLFVHWPPVHYRPRRKKNPRPEVIRPGVGCLPTLATLPAYRPRSPLQATR